MNKRQHPEVEGHDVRSLYTFELKKRGQHLRDRLLWAGGGLLLGLSLAAGVYLGLSSVWERSPLSVESSNVNPDSFQHGLETAMQAAQETQSAESREEWILVAMFWQRAIDYMQEVSSSDTNYATAAQKVQEYQRNLEYAQSNISTRESDGSKTKDFWSLGSSRAMVITAQGTPTRVERYDALCKEKLYYGDSFVELVNGQVSRYDDISKNLSVLATSGPSHVIAKGDRLFWTLGSSTSDVLAIEGPPTSMESYESIGEEFYYYGDARVEFKEGIVTGYFNSENALSVAISGSPSDSAQSQSDGQANWWSLGSNREDVLRIQQTSPTQVSHNRASCEEMIYYGASRVELKNGVVSGYDNIGNTLRVR
ncbi:MAG: hypothetical protein VKL39_03510 [Leptolyngbyaceae bacterium]|nr:hypothetical protein [Leptolyngbyaceae bacterium]